MKVIDVNVLIYAANSDSVHHEICRNWIEAGLSGTEIVSFPWTVLLAFIRITTHGRILAKPLPTNRALQYIDEWLSQPPAEIIHPGRSHWSVLRALLSASGTAGNLTQDAHLAALAIEHGATLVSTDNDFLRFSGLSVENPLEARIDPA